MIISHRANTKGKGSAIFGENHPDSIKYVLSLKFDCEIDVWYENNQFYLGHDGPSYKVPAEFFHNDKLWCHCKSIDALFKLRDNPLVKAFYHQNDDCVLTTNGNYIWTFPNKLNKLTKYSVAVLPELVPEWDLSQVYAICTDNFIKI